MIGLLVYVTLCNVHVKKVWIMVIMHINGIQLFLIFYGVYVSLQQIFLTLLIVFNFGKESS